MSGSDILVIIMGVIAVGFGVFCFLSEQIHQKKDDNVVHPEEKKEQ